MAVLKQNILDKIKQPTLSALATVPVDGRPWLRYVTPFANKNLTIWMATFADSPKIAQIKKLPEVHLTTGVTDPQTAESYLQIEGRAEILTNKKTKGAVWFDQLKGIFSGPDDPNYCVCKITPYRIEYHSMGMTPPEIWEA